MVRVFIAENDAAIRRAIRTGLNWKAEGFEPIGEAPDGSLALLMCRDLHPDILIASPRMPIIGGIELYRALRAQFPWLQLVLLTGFDGRNEAMDDAFEALVKPVNLYDLAEALHRAEARMNAKLAHINDPSRCGEAEFCHSFSELVQRCNPSGENRCRIFKVILPQPYPGWQQRICGMMLHGSADRHGSNVFILPDGHPGIILSHSDSAALEENAYEFAAGLLHSVCRSANLRVHVHISDEAEDESSLLTAYRRLAGLPIDRYRPILGSSDAMRLRPGVCPILHPMGEWLISAHEDELKPTLTLCRREGLLNPQRVALAAAQLYEEASGVPHPPLAPQDTFEAMHDQLRAAVRFAQIHAPWLADSALTQARRYLSIHFRNSTLQLYNAAQDADMVPERFRIVFAQEMGITFTEYMTAMRLSGAKALLSDTRMRLSGIARIVGFGNAEFFNEVFLAGTGMTPKAYREQFQS